MSDPVDPADTKKPLTPANQNPWYVLMTLYGEQEGEEIDWDLHEKNRRAWNAWAGQAMSAEEREAAAKSSGVSAREFSASIDARLDIQELFETVWRTRGSIRPDSSGFPDPNSRIDFHSVMFTQPFSANGFVFPNRADFGFAVFGSAAWFEEATFCGEALFISATFDRAAWFSFATFRGEAGFASARFSRQAEFTSTIFGMRVGFSSTTFNEGARFSSATFSGLTYFVGTYFGSLGGDHAISFGDCHFAKPTSFRKARFLSRFPDFEGAVLHSETTFTAKAKDEEGRFWPASPADPVAAKESCAKIRNSLGKQGLPDEEHFFYRKEMRFSGIAATNPMEKTINWFFRVFSWYGSSIVRPVVALAAVFGLGFAAYWGFFLQGTVETPLGTALGLSISNLFPYFGFARFFDPKFAVELPPVLKALGGFQTVSGAVLLFLFALGLRTRFRMR